MHAYIFCQTNKWCFLSFLYFKLKEQVDLYRMVVHNIACLLTPCFPSLINSLLTYTYFPASILIIFANLSQTPEYFII